MNKQLIDSAWRALPAEFKEEVKKLYAKFYNEKPHSDCSYGYLGLLIKLFGYHNLTSDAEGEEMLMVKASLAKELYQYAEEREKGIAPRESEEEWYQGYMKAMQDLFGSKCLPEEEPLFSNQPENYNNENPIVANDNKPTETCTDDCPSPRPSQHFDDIINRSFADHNRLHIAAMAMAGLLANEGVSCFTDVQELEHMDFITYHALEYADKLIKKLEEDEKLAEL